MYYVNTPEQFADLWFADSPDDAARMVAAAAAVGDTLAEVLFQGPDEKAVTGAGQACASMAQEMTAARRQAAPGSSFRYDPEVHRRTAEDKMRDGGALVWLVTTHDLRLVPFYGELSRLRAEAARADGPEQ